MRSQLSLRFLSVIPCLWFFVHSSFAIAGVDEALTRHLKHLAPYEEVSIIVTMRGIERPEAYQVQDRRARDGRLVKALKVHARTTLPGIKRYLKLQHAKHLKELWIINGLSATVRADQVEALAAQPGVVSVRYDAVVTLAAPLAVTTGNAPSEWNLAAVGIPDLWAAGQTGAGVVVATMDTGVEVNHPDLEGKWRGGNNSWFDPYGENLIPHDEAGVGNDSQSGHGTQVMGLLVGGNASGSNIGVAPDAKFIAAKIFNDAGEASLVGIHDAFQWLLDPDGNPNTQDAPDIVNASWGLRKANKCIVEFDTDIRMLKAAGIAVVFAGGNDGAAPATADSPASSAGVISSGAVDSELKVARFSSRGPSPCGGGFFPALVAPGESVYTTDIGSASYIIVSGSSFAAPHVSGILALLAGKHPGLSVTDLEAALTLSARDLGVIGADNEYGFGLVDAVAAMQLLDNRPAGSTPKVTSLPPTVSMVGVAYNYQVKAEDADGDSLSFSLDDFPVGMSIDTTGSIFWVPGSNLAGQHLVTVRVTDSTGLYVTQPYVVVVANINDAPIAKDDNYEMTQASKLRVLAKGILNNDTDQNNDRLHVVDFGVASIGELTGNSDGSFDYVPPSSDFIGIVTFTYSASDGAFTSAAATVTINVLENEAAALAAPGRYPGTYPINVINTPFPVFYPEEQDEVEAVVDSPDVVPVDNPDMSKTEPEQTESDTPKITSTPMTDAIQGEDYTYQVDATSKEGGELVFSLDAAPKGMTIDEYGGITWTPTSKQVGKQLVVVRVTSSAKQSATQSYVVVVENINDAPVARKDSFTLVHASTYSVAAPGVLRNDTDVDRDQLSAVGYGLASKGTLEGNADGSLSYKPPGANFTGSVTFTYRVSDGELTSDEAKVTINVIANRAPLVKGDAVTVSARQPGATYSARPIKVLANDRDPDSQFDSANVIEPTTLTIVTQPNKRGAIKVAKNGIISYTPPIGFRGVETFNYSVSDTRGAKSKTAVVRIRVK